MTTDVKIEGIEELVRKFRKLDKKARRVTMRKVIRRGARPVMTRARKNLMASRRTGFLVKNVATTVSAKSDTLVEANVGPRRRGFYGRFLELGTAYMTPRPWLVPALVSEKAKVLERIGKALKAEIEKVARL